MPDYRRFCQMLLNRGELDGARILQPATLDRMTANDLSDAIMNVRGDYNALAIGFGPSERASECVFSIALFESVSAKQRPRRLAPSAPQAASRRAVTRRA